MHFRWKVKKKNTNKKYHINLPNNCSRVPIEQDTSTPQKNLNEKLEIAYIKNQ